jgi:hypothetical protein
MTSRKVVPSPTVQLLPRTIFNIDVLVLMMFVTSQHCDISFCNVLEQKELVVMHLFPRHVCTPSVQQKLLDRSFCKKTPYSISPEGKCPPTSALSHFRPTVTSPPSPMPPAPLSAPPLLRHVLRR